MNIKLRYLPLRALFLKNFRENPSFIVAIIYYKYKLSVAFFCCAGILQSFGQVHTKKSPGIKPELFIKISTLYKRLKDLKTNA